MIRISNPVFRITLALNRKILRCQKRGMKTETGLACHKWHHIYAVLIFNVMDSRWPRSVHHCRAYRENDVDIGITLFSYCIVHWAYLVPIPNYMYISITQCHKKSAHIGTFSAYSEHGQSENHSEKTNFNCVDRLHKKTKQVNSDSAVQMHKKQEMETIKSMWRQYARTTNIHRRHVGGRLRFCDVTDHSLHIRRQTNSKQTPQRHATWRHDAQLARQVLCSVWLDVMVLVGQCGIRRQHVSTAVRGSVRRGVTAVGRRMELLAWV